MDIIEIKTERLGNCLGGLQHWMIGKKDELNKGDREKKHKFTAWEENPDGAVTCESRFKAEATVSNDSRRQVQIILRGLFVSGVIEGLGSVEWMEK